MPNPPDQTVLFTPRYTGLNQNVWSFQSQSNPGYYLTVAGYDLNTPLTLVHLEKGLPYPSQCWQLIASRTTASPTAAFELSGDSSV